MGLHICNYCDYKMNCTKAFKNNMICLSSNINVKLKQQKRFDDTELKEFREFLET